MKSVKTGAVVIVAYALVVALAAGGALAGTLQQELVQQSAVEQVIKSGVLKVGMSTFVPWAMKDKTGKLIGFEIDVATRLAEDMGTTRQSVNTYIRDLRKATTVRPEVASASAVSSLALPSEHQLVERVSWE